MTELLILGVVAVLAFIFFANRATKPKPAPTPGPDLPKNNPPIACAPLLYGGVTSSTVFIGDPVKLDLRHRVHGCDANGAALDETGAYDPEGDVIEYAVKCTGPSPDGLSQIPYTVFNDQGAQIDSAWIKNGDPRGFALAPAGPGKPIEAQALVTFFVGRRETTTPYPFTAKGCDPAPTPTPIIDGTKLGECVFAYTVRDSKGSTATNAMVFTVYKNCKV
jgi:hypothetical protein